MPWLVPIFSAFFELSTCRSEGGPIPWTAIHMYAKAHKHDDQLEWFTGLIRDMDAVYLENLSKKHKLGKTAPTKGAVGRKGKK